MAEMSEKRHAVAHSVTITNRLARQQGFTLIELLVALVLMMIGFLAVFTVLWGSAASGRFTRDMTTAASLGQDMLERAQTLGYSNLPAPGGFVNYTTARVSAVGFTRKWRIENDTPQTGTKTITATVSWNATIGEVTTKTRTFVMTMRNEY
ncbi:prepilin-type N-terminal cleavage/methylation domain-containing protein [Geobacter sp. AOG1]|uniref:type IV pilus modification PilV family protein n=1 Tax=Geobacter sp. AOG1 TaxID=1566346 RepID=UPI001CC77270|nr:type II secretion system protein [Geobacter sp. AOG1]GFE56956.1 type IV pilus minor pilin PilV [Geobacter sp. AOG1]